MPDQAALRWAPVTLLLGVARRLAIGCGEEQLILKYRVWIEPDEDGVYVAEVPSLPGGISQGQSRSEALENIKEAIAGYLES
jgi:hypothetical protein